MATPITTLRTAFGRVAAIDRDYVHRCARSRRTLADPMLKRLTVAANRSRLWFVLAGSLAVRRGSSRRAAARGIVAIAGTSAVTNAVAKLLVPRRRPPATLLPMHRRIPDPPQSSSFPSGHAASAAAFTTAVWMENPKLGAAVAPLAISVAYSRVHTGVHWPSDVAAGVLTGVGVGLATRSWWPVRPVKPGRARPSERVTRVSGGAGLAVAVNVSAGNTDDGVADQLRLRWPAATYWRLDQNDELLDQLHRLVHTAGAGIHALGVVGGDGTVAAASSVAAAHGLPLAVIPNGTLNHFARDLGVSSTDDTERALFAGTAVHVNLGTARIDSDTERSFINTAALGGYSDLVRLREKLEQRWGKWPAAAAALIHTLAHAEPITVEIDGESREIWLLFAGNGGYQPKGFAPRWRPRLDDGVVDIRYVRADLPFSRIRCIIAALTGCLTHSRTYDQQQRAHVRVELVDGPVELACDGEIHSCGELFEFTVRDEAMRVYRPENS